MLYGIKEDDDEDDTVISVHTTLVVGGYLGCTGVGLFSIVLPAITPAGDNGAMRFISEGMDAYCGFANLAMGVSSLLLVVCQLAAAAHMHTGTTAAWCVVAQTIAWFAVMAVSDTGWGVHYVALVVFLVSNLTFAYLASIDPVFGGRMYRLGVGLCVFFTLVFGAFATASILDAGANPTLRSAAVACEFVLMTAVLLLNTFVVSGLDVFRDIRLHFERQATSSL